jgi:hypothetical protein
LFSRLVLHNYAGFSTVFAKGICAAGFDPGFLIADRLAKKKIDNSYAPDKYH